MVVYSGGTWAPPHLGPPPGNERVLVALQQGGRSYLSNATVKGRFALRGCVLNYRTTRSDMETLLDDVRRAAHEVSGVPE